jgi:hypothetical protein
VEFRDLFFFGAQKTKTSDNVLACIKPADKSA